MASVTRRIPEPSNKRSGPREEAEGAIQYAKKLAYLRGLKFLEDGSGKRIGVLLTLEAFRRLMLDHWAMSSALTVKDSDLVDWDEAIAEMREDGIPAKG
jgi:hypothetical protein